ncbi:hypothetical protein SUGI_0694620 [Cryptomeria japonica]|uniref:F-box/kelch-repeat protein SKIP11-like n=1 Tax=Cryptomeria japonica TaxID=3369 RepID=UPI0024149A9C|nr:F-box/kelch-repeat protein SKIP11-like [Cryptomeria japonica]GLJ34539.1 hypothetical protein SUGI_0694620 [Cryptomeria japonica]
MDILQELPEQIFRDILLRVPYKSQSKIKQLLKPAKEIMESSRFYQDRIKFGLAEKYICVLHSNEISIYHPVEQSFKLLSRIPSIADGRCTEIINVNHKIVVLGFEYHITPFFVIYDLLSCTSKYGAEFPTPKPHGDSFAWCASPDGSIYIAGGKEGYINNKLREAAVYKVDEDKWELLPEMNQEMYPCRGVFIEGMFYVIGYNGCQRFDPTTRVWTTIINMSMPPSRSFVLNAFGQLVVYGTAGIRQYDWEGNVWRELERFPQHIFRHVCATVWRDRILFCGRPKFRMYKPGASPSERWISVDEPSIFDKILVDFVATIEI